MTARASVGSQASSAEEPSKADVLSVLFSVTWAMLVISMLKKTPNQIWIDRSFVSNITSCF